MEVLVSVIIPTYNRYDMLKRSLSSVLLQSYKNLEIIITDDHSNNIDQDLYIKTLSDPRIIYLQSPINEGFVGNINKALRIAKGKHFAILFDDDYWLPDYIKKTVEILETNNTVSFVQTGVYNDLGDIKTHYWPKLCGLFSKYLYLSYLHPGLNDNNIFWSISPCNYVFRNQKILFRETIQPTFDARQLLRGSGYDILFILDHLTNYNNCYHLNEHHCVFTSHNSSITVKFPVEVLNDSKKGIYVYFNENPCHILLEVHKYIYENLSYGNQHDDLVEIVLRLIEKYDISIYEIKKILFSNDRYNIDIKYLNQILDLDINLDITKYYDITRQYIEKNKDIPSYSLIKYIYKNNNKTNYNKYLLNKFRINNINLFSEIELVNSDEYRLAWEPSIKNAIKYYLNDFKSRNIKKIALILCSGHLKYLSLWKSSYFTSATSNFGSGLTNLLVHYLGRRYDYLEILNHKTKELDDFELELINCEEFKRKNNVQVIHNISTFKNLKRKIWLLYTLSLNYNDTMKFNNVPESEWDTIVTSLIFDSSYYENMYYFYQINDIIGENLNCSLQISGHLRYYDDLYNSLINISKFTKLDIFIYTWSDSLGLRDNIFKTTDDILSDIDNVVLKFNPIDIEYEDNKKYLMSNLIFSNFNVLETKYCSYPSVKSQLYTIWRVNELRKRYQVNHNKKYDIVFKLRFDSYFDESFCTESLFHIYYTTNFKNFIYVSNDLDHTHIGGNTGCELCNKTYWDYSNVHKHYGDHTNDICDFLAISSEKTMNHYSNLYNIFENFYKDANDDMCDRLFIYENRNKVKKERQNLLLPVDLNDSYQHFVIDPEATTEFKLVSKLPMYPECWLKIYLKDYLVVANRYFRVFFKI
jgi:glycosyltransferase involved in cell wall biosynthesis